MGYRPFTLDRGQTPAKAELLSKSELNGVDRAMPVILLVHGFTATPYEWDDFANYIDKVAGGNLRYSKVLLGGHGRSLAEFKKSNWMEWGQPIVDEYEALIGHGFTNISLAGSSTACALLLEQLHRGLYQPKNIFMIDPIVEPNGFITRLIIKIGALFRLNYPPTQVFTPEEFHHWYGYRPFSQLKSLDDLTWRVSKALAAGIRVPANTKVSIWASQNDPTVNPAGYKVIQNGLQGSIAVYPVDSRFHVFTRLSGRPEAKAEDEPLPEGREAILKAVTMAPIPFTRRDRENQKWAFDAILKLASFDVKDAQPTMVEQNEACRR
jgi:carboxylesterase